jgi:hypothetical protein
MEETDVQHSSDPDTRLIRLLPLSVCFSGSTVSFCFHYLRCHSLSSPFTPESLLIAGQRQTYPSRILHDRQKIVRDSEVVIMFLFELAFESLLDIRPDHFDAFVSIRPILLVQQSDGVSDLVNHCMFLSPKWLTLINQSESELSSEVLIKGRNALFQNHLPRLPRCLAKSAFKFWRSIVFGCSRMQLMFVCSFNCDRTSNLSLSLSLFFALSLSLSIRLLQSVIEHQKVEFDQNGPKVKLEIDVFLCFSS